MASQIARMRVENVGGLGETPVVTVRPESVRNEIWTRAERDFVQGRFDDAIFEVFKFVESSLQKHIGSSSIGKALVEEAFGGKLSISDDARDIDSARALFVGALGFYRGDRAHGEQPSVPVRDQRKCASVLALASSLLDLLDADRNVMPTVIADSVVNGMANLVCANLTPTTQCLCDDAAIEVSNMSGTSVVFSTSGLAMGSHRVTLVDGERTGPEYEFQITAPASTTPGGNNWYRVVAGDLEVFADEAGCQPTGDRAVLLEAYEGGRISPRCYPTQVGYNPGQYVTWAWNATPVVNKPGWVRLPSSDQLVCAWQASAYFAGEVTGVAAKATIVQIQLSIGSRLLLRPGSTVLVTVQATYFDGAVRWTEILSPDACVFSSADDRLVHLDKSGTLRAKGFGSVEISAVVGSKHATSVVEVSSLQAGATQVLVAGLGPVPGIAHSAAGILFTTRGPEVLSLSPKRLATIGRVDLPALSPMGLDSLCTDSQGNIYVRLPAAGRFVAVLLAPHYATLQMVELPEGYSPMGLAGLDVGVLITAAGKIWTYAPGDAAAREVATLFAYDRMATLTSIAVAGQRVYVLDNGGRLHEVDLADGTHKMRQLGLGNNYSALATVNGALYATRFYEGTVVRIEPDGETVVADRLGVPSGMCLDGEGNLLVSDLDGGRIIRVLMS